MSDAPAGRAGKRRLFTRTYLTMVVLNLLMCLYGQSMMAALPVMLTGDGYSEAMAGVAVSLFPFSSMLFRPFGAGLVRRGRHRSVLLVSLGMLCASGVVFPHLGALPLIYATRVVQGFAICLLGITLGASVARSIPPDRFEEGMGYYSIGIPAMSFVGPAISRILVGEIGSASLMYLLSILMAMAVVLCVVSGIDNQSQIAAREEKGRLRWLELASVPASLMLMLSVLAHSSVVSFLPLYADRCGLTGTVGFYLAAGVGILGIRAAVTLFRFTPPEKTALLGGYGTCVACMLLIPYFRGPVLPVVCGTLYGMSIGLIQPHFIAKALRAAPPDRREAATVTYYIGTDIGYALGGILWGLTAQHLGYGRVFPIPIAIEVLCAAVCVWSWRIRRNAPLQSHSSGI